MLHTNTVRINPIEATTVIPVTVVKVMLTTGNFPHPACLLFDFVSGSHFVQMVDPREKLSSFQTSIYTGICFSLALAGYDPNQP